MDKYLLIVLMFMVAGMIIAATSEPFNVGLFYAMLGGALVILIYTMMKGRKERRERNRERRRSKK